VATDGGQVNAVDLDLPHGVWDGIYGATEGVVKPGDPTGGPAFPQTPASYSADDAQGMSLRDYFAAHAPGVGDNMMWSQGESSVAIEAARAYRWADAMLKERAK
jgi:hypothetical protein